ncbi:Phosphoribosylaminoimidazole carboxylase [Pristimantis euphronides]
MDNVCEDVVYSKEQLLASKVMCAGLRIGRCEIDIMNRSMEAMFDILEKACLAADFILLNIKVQFGVNCESREIVVADIIEYKCRHQTQLEDKSPQEDKQNLLSPKGQGRVVVLMESMSYAGHCEKIQTSCAKYSIPSELRVSSAYTGPREILDIKSQYEGDCTPTVFITVAGRSNSLALVLSANTAYPVINCPAVTADWSAQDFWSALNMPEGLGFCTVLSPEAAAQFSAHVLGLSSHQLWSKLRSSTLNKWISMKQADEKLKDSSM